MNLSFASFYKKTAHKVFRFDQIMNLSFTSFYQKTAHKVLRFD